MCHYLCRCMPMHSKDGQCDPLQDRAPGSIGFALAHALGIYQTALDGRKQPIRGLVIRVYSSEGEAGSVRRLIASRGWLI